MKQAVHILRKDLRNLWIESTVLSGLMMLFLIAALVHANGDPFALSLTPLSWWMVARAIYAEPLIGDRQFWLTRPYAWTSLLGSKLLLIFIVGIVPSTLVRLILAIQAGFPVVSNLPGLLWSQILLWTVGFVPFAALAAVVPSLVTLVLILLFVFVILMIGDFLLPIAGSVGTNLGSLDWVRDSFAVVAIAALATMILRTQYRRRRTTFSRIVLIAGAAVICGVYVFFPWPAAFAVQEAVAGSNNENLPLRFEPVAGTHPLPTRGEAIDAAVGLEIIGVPPNMRPQIDSLHLDLIWPDGRRWQTGQRDLVGMEPRIDNSNLFRGLFHMKRSVLTPRLPVDRGIGFELEVHGTAYVTLLGNPKTRTVRLGAKPALVTAGLECMTAVISTREVVCRSPFGWSEGLVTASFGGADSRPVGNELSWSPFPAELEFAPGTIQSRTVFGSAPDGTFETTVTVFQPVAHLKRDFVWKQMVMSGGMLERSVLPEGLKFDAEHHRFQR